MIGILIPTNVRFSYPIGKKAAGVITKTGSEVADFQNGDRAILSSSLQLKGGCWAQYVAVSSIPVAGEKTETRHARGKLVVSMTETGTNCVINEHNP